MNVLIQIGGLAAFLLGFAMLIVMARDFAKYKAMILQARKHPERLEWPSVVIFAFMAYWLLASGLRAMVPALP